MLIAMIWAAAYGIEWFRDRVVGQTVSVEVEQVVDGDTFVARIPSLSQFGMAVRGRFRLRGIDAPEWAQPYGGEATKVLQSILAPHGGAAVGREVVCRVVGKDPWGRYVADVAIRNGMYATAVDVQLEMVKRGAAWSFPQFQQQRSTSTQPASLEDVMSTARNEKQGLWAIEGTPEAPWLYRQRTGKAGKRTPTLSNDAPPRPPTDEERKFMEGQGRGRTAFTKGRENRRM